MSAPAKKEPTPMLAYQEKAESLVHRVAQQWRADDAQDVKALTDAVRQALVEEANLELRQIFAQMGGALELAAARQRRGEPVLSDQKTRSLLEAVERASAILEIYLDPASAARLTIQIAPEPIDLGEAMRDFLRLHGLEGKVDAVLASVVVNADGAKLMDAVGHLVTRFYFSARRHERVVVTLAEHDGRVEGFVGLTPSHLPVEQLMEEIRVPLNVEDVGIEVAYIRAMLERHGGTLFVATGGDASTGFGFTLPLHQEAGA